MLSDKYEFFNPLFSVFTDININLMCDIIIDTYLSRLYGGDGVLGPLRPTPFWLEFCESSSFMSMFLARREQKRLQSAHVRKAGGMCHVTEFISTDKLLAR